MKRDFTIAGSGPVALMCAESLASRGARVAVVSPEVRAPWPARYGDWWQTLYDVGLEEFAEASWPTTEIVCDAQTHVIDEGYIRLDGARMQVELLDRCANLGVRFVDDTLHAAAHDPTGTTLQGQRGAYRAALAIDATGSARALTTTDGRQATAYQTAYGLLAEVAHHPYPQDRMRLMDFRDAGDPPSFLYAMPLPDGRLFVEETSLAAAPALSLDALQARLHERLARDGVVIERVIETERCIIPMDPPLPSPGQRVVAVGIAAGAVHPATGYTLARAARTAPRLADAAIEGLERGPAEAARRGHEAVWSPAARRTRALHLFGLATLLGLSSEQLVSFFDAFFALSPASRRAYLRGDAPPSAVAAAMWSVFSSLGASGRLSTLRAGAGPRSASALRSLILS